jgi:hypothetical protein
MHMHNRVTNFGLVTFVLLLLLFSLFSVACTTIDFDMGDLVDPISFDEVASTNPLDASVEMDLLNPTGFLADILYNQIYEIDIVTPTVTSTLIATDVEQQHILVMFLISSHNQTHIELLDEHNNNEIFLSVGESYVFDSHIGLTIVDIYDVAVTAEFFVLPDSALEISEIISSFYVYDVVDIVGTFLSDMRNVLNPSFTYGNFENGSNLNSNISDSLIVDAKNSNVTNTDGATDFTENSSSTLEIADNSESSSSSTGSASATSENLNGNFVVRRNRVVATNTTTVPSTPSAEPDTSNFEQQTQMQPSLQPVQTHTDGFSVGSYQPPAQQGTMQFEQPASTSSSSLIWYFSIGLLLAVVGIVCAWLFYFKKRAINVM